ncbi:PKD domain-containing protein [Halobellus captivus]|uniref:PKD domain-containing protein n=1 Tax=Halobellus captivus TaxID=2592614 RepID=UPI0011A5E772|nr:PKD domain-containing protein [Halobellus captivus]
MTDRGATEPIGTVLLVGLVVLATVTAGSGLLLRTDEISESTDDVRLNIKPDVTDSTVSLRHVGGQSFDASEVRLLLRGDSGGQVGPHALDSESVAGTDVDDGTFDVGDEVTVNHSFTGYIDVLLVSSETGDRLYHTLRSTASRTPIPTPGSNPPVAVATSVDRVAEGFSLTLDGSGSNHPSGAIESYSWSIVGGSGTITEDDTATPNATYVAPDDVSANQTVTVELTVTGANGATATDTTQFTVIDLDDENIESPTDENGDGSAFDDPNGNGIYDEGETVISKDDLEDGFDDSETDLVIYEDVGTVTGTGSELSINANTITSGVDFVARGSTISLAANGDIRIEDGILETSGNGFIEITSYEGRIIANRATIDASPGPITLNSNGDIELEAATLDGNDIQADLGTSTATLYVDQLEIAGNDVLVYDPDDITVNGTPNSGSVSPT